MKRHRHLSLLLSLYLTTTLTSAAVSCDDTNQCIELLHPDSICTDGMCTNPYAQGCLRSHFGEGNFTIRTCNSDDPPTAEADGLCISSALSYPEVRFQPGNWESAMFHAWVIQIVLSELVNTPTSIETSGGGPMNYYDTDNSFSYPQGAVDWDAIQEGNRLFDCTKSEGRPCAHVMPEVWEERRAMWEELLDKDDIEFPTPNGMLSAQGWYIPAFLAVEDPSFLSFSGLTVKGPDGAVIRRKLASTFRRPTTWGEYCERISEVGCEGNDDVARRKPEVSERDRYYVEGLYTGYFEFTSKNDCDLNPDTCVGYFVDYPCHWISFTKSQLYWNDIPLISDGPDENGGYSQSSIDEIFYAAIETKSAVMLTWWEPEARIDAMEFMRVRLPKPNQECLKNRPNVTSSRCVSSEQELIGEEIGSCDYSSQMTQKIISLSVRENALNTPEASRSPAHEIMRNMYIKDVHFAYMLKQWYTSPKHSKYNFAPRKVVCDWVVKNINELTSFLPAGYPRVIVEEDTYNEPYLHVAIFIGCLILSIVIASSVYTFKRREAKVLRYAGVNFLYLLLVGFFLVCLSAIVTATPPSKGSCITRQWLETIGFTLGLAPLLIKVAAMNKIVQGAENFRTVNITKETLFGIVAAAVVVISIYLTVWTILDPPTRKEERYISQEGGDVIALRVGCESNSPVWMYIALLWEFLQVLCASLLAFQSRKIRQEFNESKTLANLAYAHFLFLIGRITVNTLLADVLEPPMQEGITSYLLSFDSLATLSIYFFPKFYAIKLNAENAARTTATTVSGMRSTQARSSGGPSNRSSGQSASSQ